jgi:hypothetical protein
MASNGYDTIREFIGINYGYLPDYENSIEDLWPVIAKCREAAIANPDRLLKAWLAICLELYKVPTEPSEFKFLFDTVVGFIQLSKQ